MFTVEEKVIAVGAVLGLAFCDAVFVADFAVVQCAVLSHELTDGR